MVRMGRLELDPQHTLPPENRESYFDLFTIIIAKILAEGHKEAFRSK